MTERSRIENPADACFCAFKSS